MTTVAVATHSREKVTSVNVGLFSCSTCTVKLYSCFIYIYLYICLNAGLTGSRVRLFSLSRPATHEIRLTRSIPVRPFSESSVFYASKDGIKDGDGGKVDVFFY